MSGEVIKEFLVGLNFSVDETTLAKFNKSITNAAVKVVALYTTVSAAAGGIFHGISKISEGFEDMGYSLHLIAPAINKAIFLRHEMLRAYAATGTNLIKVIQQSIKFNLSLERTKIAMKAIYTSVGARFFPLLTKQMDLFRKQIYQNMPKIQNMLERFVKFIFATFGALVTLGERAWSILGRVYDFFVKLHEATGGWSTILLGVLAVWKLLNLSFLATPLGRLIAGLVAILALYDDFKTFQEGGDSLFNWSKAIPVIEAVQSALEVLKRKYLAIIDVIGNVVLAIYQLFHSDMSGAIESLKAAGNALLGIFGGLWDIIKGIDEVLTGSLMSAFVSIKGLFGGNDDDQSKPHIQRNPNKLLGVGTNPLGTDVSNSSLSNYNVSQQTNINLMGTASTEANANAVGGQLSRVNSSMVRNMRPRAQ